MVAFARAKAKSIFSKLRFNSISKIAIEKDKRKAIKNKANEKENNSNYFLEAIKRG